jgi:hypothetical protein
MWTTDKKEKLMELLKERMVIERSPDKYLAWGLPRSWKDVIDLHINDKQSMLNDLIDDKVRALGLEQTSLNVGSTSIGVSITSLNNMKE